jgi:signal transduction histidine kinase
MMRHLSHEAAGKPILGSCLPFCNVGFGSDRAGDIIDRIRDHIKKAPPRKDRLDLNEAINEVIVLARSAITENGVSVQTRLTEGPLLVQGDRVQVQQGVLNLILNAVEAMGSVEAGPRELLIRTEQHQPNGVLVAVGRALIQKISSAFLNLSTPRNPAE